MADRLLISLGLLGIFGLFLHLYNTLVKKPDKLRSKLRKQGIDGPPSKFLLGNTGEMRKALSSKAKTPTKEVPVHHNCSDAFFPLFDRWRNQYGKIFMFALGSTQILYVTQPDVLRELTTCTSLDLGKPSYQHRDYDPLLGQGIITSSGASWAHQRKILAPELYMDKVKGMINIITESAITVVNSWMGKIETNCGIVEIEIDEHMRSFSGDVITKACFGSNYLDGEQIFLKLRALQEAMSKKLYSSRIPGMRYLPTKSNRETWALQKDVDNLILKVAKERVEGAYKEDLLQNLFEGAKNSNQSQDAIGRFIIDNCKNIYLAGYETTAVSATWCLMFLASDEEWQARVRAEVLQVCNDQNPDAHMLPKMKQLTMVINETLRLYPVVPVFSREAIKDMKFGDIHVPKKLNIWIPVVSLHTDPEIWGPDSYKFDPERFGNGIMGACKLPHLYMPFGVGPRICLGQNLAMVEFKILIALILSKFSLSLSPNYSHSPALRLIIVPENGVQILVRKLNEPALRLPLYHM